MIQHISQRLREVNDCLAACGREGIPFDRAEVISLFYRDFNDTNNLIEEAGRIAKENPGQLPDLFLSLISETGTYMSLDRTGLYATDFERIFKEHLRPFELRHEEAMAAATRLWRDYYGKSNRLDCLPLDSEEYRSLERECDAAKAEYDRAQAHVSRLYEELTKERDGHFHVYSFRPQFLDVLVERLKGISESVVADIRRSEEDRA